MTWQGPADVLKFAQDAGFRGQDAKVAAAVALVTTRGQDAYEYHYPTTPGLHQVGLWGQNVPDVDKGTQRTYLDPREAARLAYETWVANDRTWDWHACYWADAGAGVLQLVKNLDATSGWKVQAHHLYGPLSTSPLHTEVPSLHDVLNSGPTVGFG